MGFLEWMILFFTIKAISTEEPYFRSGRYEIMRNMFDRIKEKDNGQLYVPNYASRVAEEEPDSMEPSRFLGNEPLYNMQSENSGILGSSQGSSNSDQAGDFDIEGNLDQNVLPETRQSADIDTKKTNRLTIVVNGHSLHIRPPHYNLWNKALQRNTDSWHSLSKEKNVQLMKISNQNKQPVSIQLEHDLQQNPQFISWQKDTQTYDSNNQHQLQQPHHTYHPLGQYPQVYGSYPYQPQGHRESYPLENLDNKPHGYYITPQEYPESYVPVHETREYPEPHAPVQQPLEYPVPHVPVQQPLEYSEPQVPVQKPQEYPEPHVPVQKPQEYPEPHISVLKPRGNPELHPSETDSNFPRYGTTVSAIVVAPENIESTFVKKPKPHEVILSRNNANTISSFVDNVSEIIVTPDTDGSGVFQLSSEVTFTEKTNLQHFDEDNEIISNDNTNSEQDSKFMFEQDGSGDTETEMNSIGMIEENVNVHSNLTENELSQQMFADGFIETDSNAMDSSDHISRKNVMGRFIDLFGSSNDSSTPCMTPRDEPGHCKSIRHCILHDVLNNYILFLEYMCLIRGTLVGVCCPDNPVISETSKPDDDSDAENTLPLEYNQPPEGCGLNTKTRIVGGSVSQPHEWTWMVALLRRNRFFCGGVIINDWYVLTAAHCTLGINIRDLKIRLGEYNFLDSRTVHEDIDIAEIKRHAQFITVTFQHDIALLKLKRKISYSKYVGSICLPQRDKDYDDVNATVVGWGTVSFGGSVSPILRQVTVPVWRNTDCDHTYILENINEAFLCAGSPDTEQDACQGDSGGPLMAMNDRRWEVIGIVSWGRRCGDPNYPGVYTRVTSYLDWIKENIR